MNAILNIKAPKNEKKKQLSQFIGIVKYYRDMWFCRSELLAPLTSPTSSNIKIEWHSSHQQVLNKIKKVIGTEILLCYPDLNKPIHLYTDASDHQLETFIMQDKKPIAFYLRKLDTA
jgi:hypothetical protein